MSPPESSSGSFSSETGFRSRIRCQGISKIYPGVRANDDISLAIRPGEIHALLGENGAGKSTLMKILYGVTNPDTGQIWWNGEPVSIRSPGQARDLGIGMVFQHFSLFETLTVAENIALGLPADQARDRQQLNERIRSVSERYGIAVDPDRQVHTLSIGERQRVEIIRCLLQNISLLILDEPTSVLTPQEVNRLFDSLRTLSDEGCSILFISHKLHEVQTLCHGATVLRNGKVSGECDPRTTSTTEMAAMMVGSHTELGVPYPKVDGGRELLTLHKLSANKEDDFGTDLQDISLDVRAGQILGIAGVAGNGQKELLKLLSGERHAPQANQITLEGQAIGQLSPYKRRRLGIATVPEERLGRGAVPEMSLKENGLLTGFLENLLQLGFLRNSRIANFSSNVVERFGVKAAGIHAEARSLSGGNLQKFIIGREIQQNPKLLICASPTWGVDVGAANTIHQALISLRDQGTAIIVISEDLDELFQISDRIGALCHGQLSPIKPIQNTSIEEVGGWMAGVFDAPETEDQAEAVAL
ncbi:ABC transporter ATP-binding protein [Parendozoicomonas haliclonae]|uniref:Galactose/methyl galactoside import ATP-binding protein MglA n=1 Tax=Parendozoicomonas haliclonae TaxID=1960125 RepID=A0A1X7AK85_9GAMM|nr:ABC transporter ATP-binding protein [Parendozoicomonas haliclonae]SMA47575.1 Galactose/methyl galactoside import ATP-binding protein MglA [Parendozoicomonas haliclonae]